MSTQGQGSKATPATTMEQELTNSKSSKAKNNQAKNPQAKGKKSSTKKKEKSNKNKQQTKKVTTKPKTSKKRKHEEHDPESNQGAIVPVRKPQLSGDDEEDTLYVGQFTRAKRFCESLLNEWKEECGEAGISDPEQRAQGETAESLGLVHAKDIRLSRKIVNQLRFISQEDIHAQYEKLAILCRLLSKKTLSHEMLHAMRFMTNSLNPADCFRTRCDKQTLYREIIHDCHNTYPPKDGGDDMSEEAIKQAARSFNLVDEMVKTEEDLMKLVDSTEE